MPHLTGEKDVTETVSVETVVVPEIITHPVPSRLLDASQCPTPHINSMEQYRKMWKESVEEPSKFFGNVRYIKYIKILYQFY
jgi:acetyl-CoA synthetase